MRAFQAVATQPWAIQPEWLRTIADIAQRHNDDPAAVRAKLGRPLDNNWSVEVRDGVAIVPVTGPIFPRANMLTELSGATSLEIMMLGFNQAMDDPSIGATIVNYDSPGGVAFGISEAAAMIRARATEKPVVAYIGGLGASAAYWLATAASEVVVERTALVGSIGVVQAVSVQEQPDMNGYRDYEIVSSNAENKRPDPRTAKGLATIQSELDDLESEFIKAVAIYRGVDTETVRTEFARGGVLIAEKAVAAGMVDRIGTFENVLADLAGRIAAGGGNGAASGGRRMTSRGGSAMSNNEGTAAAESSPEITMATIKADHPAVAEALQAEGRESVDLAAAKAEGAQTERERIAGILRCDAAKGRERTAFALALTPGMSAEAAAETLETVPKSDGKAGVLAALAGDEAGDKPNAGVGAGEQSAIDPSAPIEDRARAEWDKDEKVRAEFGGKFDSYLAYRKGEDGGGIRRLKTA